MRRLSVLLSALTIVSPAKLVPAHPHAESLAADIALKGRAHRYATVEVRTTCQLGPCSVTTTANRKGRWNALLNVVLPDGREHIRLRALSGDAEYAKTYALSFPDSTLPATGPELNVIGDSLAVGTDAPLRADLPGWRVTTDGRVSRPLAEGMAMLAMTPLPDSPRVLAFSLFTNDDPTHVDELQDAVQASLARLGTEDCALWATIVRPKVGGVTYTAANRELRSLAEQDPRLEIVDWAKAVQHHRSWLTKDHVHPTPAGYAERAKLYASAAEACTTVSGSG